MARKHYFVDEAGNFDFSTKRDASRYFILTTVSMDACAAADALIPLRRELAWEGLPIIDYFHATTDKQNIRDRIFAEIAKMDIGIYATIFEKRKTVPRRQQMMPFYKLTWYHHAKNTIPDLVADDEELHVIAASIGTKKTQISVASAIKDVVHQCGRRNDTTRVSHWPASVDPCLQVADYCCWAIQRKWERNDDRSYKLVKHLVQWEKDMWSWGTYQY